MVFLVVLNVGQQPGPQAQPQVLLLDPERIRNFERVQPGQVPKPRVLQPSHVRQRIVDHLLHPAPGQDVLHRIPQGPGIIGYVGRDPTRQRRSWNIVVSRDSGHFFHQVVLDAYVRTPVWRRDLQAILPRLLAFKCQRLQHFPHLLHLYRYAQDLLYSCLCQVHRRLLPYPGIHVYDVFRHRAAS